MQPNIESLKDSADETLESMSKESFAHACFALH